MHEITACNDFMYKLTGLITVDFGIGGLNNSSTDGETVTNLTSGQPVKDYHSVHQLFIIVLHAGSGETITDLIPTYPATLF